MPTVIVWRKCGIIDRQVQWKDYEVTVPETGFIVNMIGGQTGSGKTSAVLIQAGGKPTSTGGASDTKHCSIYEVKDARGVAYLILDTVGLLDTASTNQDRSKHIEELILFLQTKNIKVAQLFFTSSLGMRTMTDTVKWMTTLMSALSPSGPDAVAVRSHWLCTRFNRDSENGIDAVETDKKSETGLYQTLQAHKIGFGVVEHGFNNTEDWFKAMAHTNSMKRALDNAEMDPHALHHDAMVKTVSELHDIFNTQKMSIAQLKTDADFEQEVKMLQTHIKTSSKRLAECGSCSDKKKDEYRAAIATATAAIIESQKSMNSNTSTRESKAKELSDLNESLSSQLAILAQRESLTECLGSIAGVAKNAAEVFGLVVPKFSKP